MEPKRYRDLNPKMTSVANEICNSICKYYNEDYLELLFENRQIVIEDVIFQILLECCRYTYLSNSEKHPIAFTLNGMGLNRNLNEKL